MTKRQDAAPCTLCQAVESLTSHHLVPRKEGGADGPTAEVCLPCHRQLHVLHDHETLATRLNTLDALRADPAIAAYLRWKRKAKRVPTPKRQRR